MKMLSQLVGSGVAGLMVSYTIYQHLPSILHEPIDSFTSRYYRKFTLKLPFVSTLIVTIKTKLMTPFNATLVISLLPIEAKSMNADYDEDAKTLLLKLGDNEEIKDDYNAVKVSWTFVKEHTKQPLISYARSNNDKRFVYFQFFLLQFAKQLIFSLCHLLTLLYFLTFETNMVFSLFIRSRPRYSHKKKVMSSLKT